MTLIRSIIIEDELPAREILKVYLEDIPGWELTAEFSNAIDAIDYLSRHPVDVAQSLRKREQKTQRMIFGRQKRLHNALYFKTKLKWKEFRLSSGGWYPYMPGTPSLYTRSVTDLRQGFRVWKDYVSRAQDVYADDSGQVLHIRFEDFLDQPRQGIRQICDFAGLSLDPQTEEDIFATLNPRRKFAFSGDPELLEFYRSIQNDPLVQKTGYHTTGAS